MAISDKLTQLIEIKESQRALLDLLKTLPWADYLTKMVKKSDYDDLLEKYNELLKTDCKVSYKLTNVVSSSDVTKVAKDASYSTILSTTNSYTLDHVVITMDGVDITDESFLNNTVSIAKATGNISVTAKANVKIANVSHILNGLVSNGSPTVEYDSVYTEILTAENGYLLPDTVAIQMNGNILPLSSYTYDKASGSLSIPDVNGDITIAASGISYEMDLYSYSTFASMKINSSKEVMLTNPHKQNGYILGYDGSSVLSEGDGFAVEQDIENNAYLVKDDDRYRMILSKQQGEKEVEVDRTFSVSGTFNNTALTSLTTTISGYNAYGLATTTLSSATRTANTTITFDGKTFPRTVYVYLRKSANGATATATVSSGGSGTITATTSTSTSVPTSISSYTAITMTGPTLVISTTVQRGSYGQNAGLVILVPNNIKETDIVPGDIYYTLTSKVGGMSPSGTTGTVTWSSTPMQFTIANPTSLGTSTDLTEGVAADNNPNFVRFINPSSNYLNAGGSSSSLKFATGTGEWSVWYIYNPTGESGEETHEVTVEEINSQYKSENFGGGVDIVKEEDGSMTCSTNLISTTTDGSVFPNSNIVMPDIKHIKFQATRSAYWLVMGTEYNNESNDGKPTGYETVMYVGATDYTGLNGQVADINSAQGSYGGWQNNGPGSETNGIKVTAANAASKGIIINNDAAYSINDWVEVINNGNTFAVNTSSDGIVWQSYITADLTRLTECSHLNYESVGFVFGIAGNETAGITDTNVLFKNLTVVADDKYVVLLVAGQSNAVGYDESKVTAEDIAQESEDIVQLGYLGDDNLKIVPLGHCAQNYQNLATAGYTNGQSVSDPNGQYGTKGIHLPLARLLLDDTSLVPKGYKVLVIPAAYGATGFVNTTDGSYNSSTMTPSGQGTGGWRTSGALYKATVDRLKYVLDMNVDNKYLGCVWIQGEQDSSNPSTHLTQFSAMVSDFNSQMNASYSDRTLDGNGFTNDIWWNMRSTCYWTGDSPSASYGSASGYRTILTNYQNWNADSYIEFSTDDNDTNYVCDGTPPSTRVSSTYSSHFGNNSFRTKIAPIVYNKIKEHFTK